MPQICRFQRGGTAPRLGLLDGSQIRDLSAAGVAAFADLDAALQLSLAELRGLVAQTAGSNLPVYELGQGGTRLVMPLQSQEVWAVGVSYLRSREARMEESREKTVYERVYEAERPEIFQKASPSRTVGSEQTMRLRHDSTWDAPEPELALLMNSRLELVGFTAGNDLSSRSIEGDNPLYLPQAKTWYGCCSVGPAITPVWERDPSRPFQIDLRILRNGEEAFVGSTSSSQLARTFEVLLEYLGRDNTFPHGVFLLTGTGIVPPAEFTLAGGDVMEITVEDIGVLRNPVERGDGRYVPPA